MKRLFVFFCAGLIFISGCATIMHGTTQNVGISSSPTQAEIEIDNQIYGKTPLIAKISRGDNHIVKLKMEGFHPYETTLTRTVSGWVAGNILFGGLIGLAVDAISGGLYNLTPEQISAAMITNNIKVSQKDSFLMIAVVLKPLPEWNKIATLKPLNTK